VAAKSRAKGPSALADRSMAVRTPVITSSRAVAVSIGMTKVQHVKIPVTELAGSVAWYSRLFDLVPFREFVEHGALRGAALRSPEAGFAVALRERQFCASQPARPGRVRPGRFPHGQPRGAGGPGREV
jgi:hypothetical protein